MTLPLRILGKSAKHEARCSRIGLPNACSICRAIFPGRAGSTGTLQTTHTTRLLAIARIHQAYGCDLAQGGQLQHLSLDLRRPDPLAGDFERVVGTAQHVEVPVSVLLHQITVRPHARHLSPAGVQVVRVVVPETARHADERPGDGQLTHFGPDPGAVRRVGESPTPGEALLKAETLIGSTGTLARGAPEASVPPMWLMIGKVLRPNQPHSRLTGRVSARQTWNGNSR